MDGEFWGCVFVVLEPALLAIIAFLLYMIAVHIGAI
jgi:hypothetical protein